MYLPSASRAWLPEPTGAGIAAGEGTLFAPVAARAGESTGAPASPTAAFDSARRPLKRSRIASAACRSRRAAGSDDADDEAGEDACERAASTAETIGRVTRDAPANELCERHRSAKRTTTKAPSSKEPHTHGRRIAKH